MTIDDLIHEVQRLQQEVAALAAATRQAQPPPAVPQSGLPPRPGTINPSAGAANHLNNILNGGHGIPTSHITPEEQATRVARQAAVVKCAEASRAMAMATIQWHIVLPRPNVEDWVKDPNYAWPGWDIIAAHAGSLNPRPI